MPTLYVENIPQELYEALRGRARARHRSIAAEVLSLLEENIPTAAELKARRAFLRKIDRLSAKLRTSNRKFPSTEEMLREDRLR